MLIKFADVAKLGGVLIVPSQEDRMVPHWASEGSAWAGPGHPGLGPVVTVRMLVGLAEHSLLARPCTEPTWAPGAWVPAAHTPGGLKQLSTPLQATMGSSLTDGSPRGCGSCEPGGRHPRHKRERPQLPVQRAVSTHGSSMKLPQGASFGKWGAIRKL